MKESLLEGKKIRKIPEGKKDDSVRCDKGKLGYIVI
jgi:hypothetical protein